MNYLSTVSLFGEQFELGAPPPLGAITVAEDIERAESKQVLLL